MTLGNITCKAVLDAVNGGLIVLDRGGRIVHWNAWMRAASGVEEEAATGRLLAEIFPRSPMRRLSSAISAALNLNASTILTHALNPSVLPLQNPSRQPLLHDLTIAPIGRTAPEGCVIAVTDVTEATRRVRYLREQQDARYDAVVASAPDAILTVDEAGFVRFANPAACACFGRQQGDLVGKAAGPLFESQSAWARLLRGAIAGTPIDEPIELSAGCGGGEPRCYEASALRWRSGARLFATLILRDVTEHRALVAALRCSERESRKAAAALAELNRTLEERVQSRTAQLVKTEEALRHSQKMEAIGNLTGGIAHDFNNLLHVISGNLHLLQHYVDGNPAAERRIQIALDGVSRSAKLSSQLLAFARRQPLSPRVINLGRFIHGMEDMIRRAVGEGVALEMSIPEGLWNTLIDPGNVENALLNIAINARDAMRGEGRLSIQVANVILESEPDHVAVEQGLMPGQYVMIAMSDSGCGMSADVIEQAFEPFFTTKSEGRGTGLGLSMVYGFVKQSGGQVTIESEVGRGSTIRLYLPRSMLAEDSLVAMDSISPSGGSETVLIAEDDDSVRETVAAMLCELGYRVLKANDAQRALSIIESGMPIDLLFTDVIMPGPLKSAELVRRARERMPNLAVLYTSGYTADALDSSGRVEQGVELLMKPYSRDALARKLRQALANSSCRMAPHADGGRSAEPRVASDPLQRL
jgi:PAS domain S-box-containing protein